MGTERQPLLSTSPLVALVNPSTSPLVMMVLLPLLSLATAVLAAPSPMADYVYDGSDAEDFANLTMSRAAEERAINTCNCAPVSSSSWHLRLPRVQPPPPPLGRAPQPWAPLDGDEQADLILGHLVSPGLEGVLEHLGVNLAPC